MASALRQPILSLTSKLMQISPKAATAPVLKALTAPQIATRGLTLSRNLWCATFKTSILNSKTSSHKHGKLCGCCSLHTEGDEKLASFLEKEIQDEQSTAQAATSIEGWNVKTDGTGVLLTKPFKDETLQVEFDVNDSVDSEEQMFESAEQAEAPGLVSKPPFEVTIQKKSGRKLRFFCEFSAPEPEFADDGTTPQESIADQFSIVEVRLGEDAKSGDMEKFYTMDGAVMDGTLYDLLMDMLDERGIDDDFINEMVAFATAYEFKLYLKFLENLKSVISEK